MPSFSKTVEDDEEVIDDLECWKSDFSNSINRRLRSVKLLNCKLLLSRLLSAVVISSLPHVEGVNEKSDASDEVRETIVVDSVSEMSLSLTERVSVIEDVSEEPHDDDGGPGVGDATFSYWPMGRRRPKSKLVSFSPRILAVRSGFRGAIDDRTSPKRDIQKKSKINKPHNNNTHAN